MKFFLHSMGRHAIFLYFLCFCLGSYGAFAQTSVNVSGTVSDRDGPIYGATIQVKGKSLGTSSDVDGRYMLTVSEIDTLVFSYMGYESQSFLVGSRTVFDVVLLESLRTLDAVVVNAGYYTVSEKERTGSIASVRAEAIEKQPITNALSAVQGRMTGVHITQNTGVAGGGFSIQIRGVNSLRSEGNAPLYIIDGMPVSATTPSFNSAGILPSHEMNPLNALNPNDIQSIEILKDADATAIYGARGANGVVLITTKKGGVTGKTQFTVNASQGWSQVASQMELMSTSDYLTMRAQAYANDGIANYPANAYDVNGTWDANRHTDWQKELIGTTALNSLVHLSVAGGNGQTRFMLSGSHQEQTTVFSEDFRYKTNNVTGSLEHQSSDNRFQVSLTGLFSDQTNNLIRSDITNQALRLAPNAPALYQEDGSLNWENNTFTNPLAANESTYANTTRTFTTNANLQYALFPKLLLKVNTGLNQQVFEEWSLRPSTMYNPAYGVTPASSVATKGTSQRFSYLVEPQIEYQITASKHRVQVLLGGTYQERTSDVLGLYSYGFESNALIHSLEAASGVMVTDDVRTSYRYAALFGRINYSHDGKYILNLTGRRDGSSRFGPNNRFANFGAVGFAWLFSKEDLVSDSKWLSFGKLRGSYGVTGSDALGDYQYLDTYTVSSTGYQGGSVLYPSRLNNPYFSWEKTTKFEVALETGFLKDRLRFNAAWYQNRSGNQLVGIPLPATTGFSSIQANLPATVENRGWEFELQAMPVTFEEGQWHSSVNLSIPRNELVAFPDLEGSTYANSYVVGYPLSIQKVYQYEGIDPETGLFQFTDFNEDGVISSPADNQVIQKIGVEYFGEWNNQVQYKHWDFSCLFQFVKQVQRNYNALMATPGTMNNQPIEVNNVWSATNPDGHYMPYTTSTGGERGRLYSYYRNSTAAISDASFIRLKNVQLSYHLPIGKGMQDVRIYLQGQNLWTLTDYFGLDPEFVATGFLPPLKTYALGVQLKF
ncbi:TonB-linked outer membrane protein, SusC/RagA family [Pustulibacterium marinum]|uniref:TonB-linked outer membrane protein, SusC/RagA family n=1 Tax=Pustulibacterium marinum TaxID=1224947 RepID=A0A1I7IYV4_9FLAO|nr:SusC/RagA family TonB-linked outer membrane protein [Pustulibacterium marinum]SFU78123.1 TonB-linked outer membrane protein, SusC/RagA family [Pustulibacterium marinum]